MGRMIQNIPIKIVDIDCFARDIGPSVVATNSISLFWMIRQTFWDLAVSVGINELTWSQKIGDKTIDLLSFDWDSLNHPAHNSDLTPSNFFLFTMLKEHMSGKCFSTDKEMKNTMCEWLRRLRGWRQRATQEYESWSRFTKCLNAITWKNSTLLV